MGDIVSSVLRARSDGGKLASLWERVTSCPCVYLDVWSIGDVGYLCSLAHSASRIALSFTSWGLFSSPFLHLKNNQQNPYFHKRFFFLLAVKS